MLRGTAMLLDASAIGRVSTGLEALDEALGGLYWGDNVVWQLDRAPVEPFYRAIAGVGDVFDTKTVVSLGSAVNTYGIPGLTIVDAGPGSELVQPADLLREIHRMCHPRGHRLILFESLDSMVRAWGAGGAREFFARCCPLLLDVGAIAYWTMTARHTPPTVQETVQAVTQCVVRVDERSLRVIKAEGRGEAVKGSVLHWHEVGGRPVLAPLEIVDRVAASLRTIRRSRSLSQHELGDLAGVTASAISQVERAERGLSLTTVVRLSAALGVTVDELLRGEERGFYRVGRRSDDPLRGLDRTLTLLGGEDSDLRVELVHLDPRESRGRPLVRPGTGIVAVASGLVQVKVGSQMPALRHGEVVVAASEHIEGVRNLGQTEALLFLIDLAGFKA